MPLNTSCRALVHALEGGIYLVEIANGAVNDYVKSTATNQIQHFHALHAARQCARDLGIDRIDMALDTPYDQMIGLRSVG
jgi:hypothetical protein